MTVGTRTRVLISGSGIAGSSLAHWLARHGGFDVTVVERAPAFRPGGQAIDVRGPALDVAERMGILPSLREHATDMLGMSVVDGSGREVYRSTERTLTGGELASPDVEIMRDDLNEIIQRACPGGVAYRYGDWVIALDDRDEEGVRVAFREAPPETFDLVVGADGLHSAVRAAAFGPERGFIHHLGSYLAVFTAPNFLNLDRWQVFCRAGEPGAEVFGGVMSARDNSESRVYLGFGSEEPLEYDVRDVAAQRRLVAERLTGAGWEFDRIVKYLWDAADFHFDSMSQIHMDSWSRGRVVLLGDAGYCGSPMSGQGTSMAMVGAYVLAGELKTAAGEHRAAFAAYEGELREYVAGNQAIALTSRQRMAAEVDGTADALDLPRLEDVVHGLRLKDY
ncbi:FAD-dependent monooxygenase [Streptomyces sp. ICBB 8177]|uniref:FAD-dependent monooxygenase n=1 Tax=Streptomyces sp. ICBB 8177 TaxID=563922 RepID=UPI000D680991|nr:FAD-dependent monooxygenase [Streptomyces sp. ICBB 8177]PWI45465.1 FAD-dependent oxidoreductase [Streptomyces sp. ICBB 8177]